MLGALAHEWVRIRTVRSTWVLMSTGFGLSVLVAIATALGIRDRPLDPAALAALLTTVTFFVPVVAGVLGVLAVTTALAVATIVAACIAGRALAGPELAGLDVPAGRVVGAVLYVGLWALFGVALGSLVRHAAGALVLLPLWPFVIEPLAVGLAVFDPLAGLRPILPFLPATAGRRMYAGDGGARLFDEVALLPPAVGAMVFAAYAVALLLVAVAVFERRDA